MSQANAQPKICVVGSANVDLTFRTPRLPLPGETIAGRSLQQGMGGKGANQAVVAARLGADVTFIARLGSDPFGQQAIHAYRAEGIDTTFVRQDSQSPTGTAAILVDDEAENSIIVVPGANERLTADDVTTAMEVVQESNVVLCQLETPCEAAITAFEIARESQSKTILTPAPATDIPDALLTLCDVCVPNRTEIATLVGAPVEDQQDAIRAAQLLREKGVEQVAVTLGKAGVLLVDDRGACHVPASSVAATDTTGAGDAFTGSLAVALASGVPFQEAARRAALVAAITVTRPGTQTAFPHLDEVPGFAS